MTSPDFAIETVGREAQRIVVIDGFARDPDDLRSAAAGAAFGPALNHYPGIRAELPAAYLDEQMPVIERAVAAAFGGEGVSLIDASFSMVTRPPDRLSIRQRLPHCDAFDADRIALVHYLDPAGSDGTAFYRHRATGFETVDDVRAPILFGQIEAEIRHGAPPPPEYVDGDTPLFEQVLQIPARYNRALLYPSYLLHSGAISPGAVLSSDPAKGRLTVTGFFTRT